MRLRQLTLLLFAFTALPCFWALAQSPLSQRLDSLMLMAEQLGVFNGNVLVAHQNTLFYRRSFGYADGSRSRKLSLDKLFDIGSIAKEFNGAGMLLLQQRGKLALNHPLRRYLPGLPAWADSLQLRHLLNYTSGLPLSAATSDEEILAELKSLKTLAFKPGQGYLYSYANVYLQRRVIEVVSGQSYNAFVTDQLLKPLGMNQTVMDLPVTAPVMARAFDARFTETTYEQHLSGWPRLPIDDLYTWLINLDSARVVNQKALQTLALDFGGNESSLGHALFKDGQLIWHQHHGSNYNYEALMTHDVASGIVVILLTNSQQFKVHALTNSIIALLKGQPYTVPKRSLYLDLREKVLADFDQGIAFYRAVRQHQPDRYDLSFEIGDLVNTGKYLLRRERYEEAIRLFELSTTLPGRPGDYSYAYQLIAEGYAKRGLRELAILYYQKALDKDPANKTAQGYLAELLR